MLNATFLHYAAAHSSAPEAAHRLREALVRQTGSPVKAQAASDLVVTCFDHDDFEKAQAWHRGTYGDPWWQARFADKAYEMVAGRHDRINLARSAASAVAFCLAELEMGGMSRCSVRAAEAGWHILDDDELVAEIQPVLYAEVLPEQESRVEGLLEGLRAYGEDGRIAARLSELPGLGSIRAIGPAGIHATAAGPVVLRTPRSYSRGLRLNIQEHLGLELGQGESQECLAALFGFASWNELVALEARCKGVWRPVSLAAYERDGREIWVRTFRSAAAGVWAFADAVKKDPRSPKPELWGYTGFTGTISLAATAEERQSVLDDSPTLVDFTAWPVCTEVAEADLTAAQSLLAKATENAQAEQGRRHG